MAFNTIQFLFLFLPVAIILYFLVPGKIKSLILILLSLVFYAWGDPSQLILLVFSILFNFAGGIEIAALKRNEQHKAAKAALAGTVIADLAMLAFYKYSGFLLGGLFPSFTAPPLPVGISFFTFTVLSYIFDVYYERAEAETNFFAFALYVSFFPKLVSGPIVEYKDIREQLRVRNHTLEGFGEGVQLFLTGLFKKVLIADVLGGAFQSVYAVESKTTVLAWLGMIFYSLQLYFDFSGYSDMAIGLARMFGFKFDKNFDHPYAADGMTDFWRRWHISLGHWFRDYVYIPLGGNRVGAGRQVLNLMVVWFLTGLWHGAGWTFICWGLYHGIWILIEKFALGRVRTKIPKVIRIGVTVLIDFIGWIFFFTPTIADAAQYIGLLFGGAAGFWDAATGYYLMENIIPLILAVILCVPATGQAFRHFAGERGLRGSVISVVMSIVLFAFCVAGIISSTYSSFLYFKF